MNQTTIQIDDETKRRMTQLAAWYGLPNSRHVTAILQTAVQQLHAIEAARRSLSDSDFVGFLAEMYRPID
jgi:predicted transcriptional regulator